MAEVAVCQVRVKRPSHESDDQRRLGKTLTMTALARLGMTIAGLVKVVLGMLPGVQRAMQ
jgi:hypothetical protein